MPRKQNLQRNVIERFTEKTHGGAAESIAREPGEDQAKQHLRRFLKMVANRRQQILERMLMDED